MQYGTLRGESVQKCLMQLRSQYGSDVFVIDTREISESGFLGTGLFKKKIYEVDYMIKEQNAPYHNRKSPERKSSTRKKTAEQAALSFLAGGSASTGDDSWPSREKKSRSSEYPTSVRKPALPATEAAEQWPSTEKRAPASQGQKEDSQAESGKSREEVDVPELDQLIASLKALKDETGKDLERSRGEEKKEEESDARMERLLKKMDAMARAEGMQNSWSAPGSSRNAPGLTQGNARAPASQQVIKVAEPPSAEEIDALWSDKYDPTRPAAEMPAEAELSDEELMAAAEKEVERLAQPEPSMASSAGRKLEINTGRGWSGASLAGSSNQSYNDPESERGTMTAVAQDPTARKFMQIRQRLLDSSLSSDLADRIIRSVDDSLSRNDRQQPGRIEEVTLSKLSNMIRMVPDIAPPRGECRAVMLVGPTGSGKTSSIAKLATRYLLHEKREVSIYNLDLYRLGATEMLKVHAEIIGAPFYAPLSVEEFRKQMDEDPAEIMLIDTAGISGRDGRLQDIQAFRDACPVKLDVHLTVAAGTESRMVDRVFETFDSFGFDKILLTKLDETDFFGAFIEHADKFNRPFSFLMDGPGVPGNIMDARPDDLARMLLD
ncbi:MAG: hypothetical protein CMN77_01405 [Spirochaetaceae bacterium]|nr:hypothetical protein [Spirochaetaceae bacterium]|tara:strand:- start:32869 stop:34689 length:1821 start_codon:yes stop_codon:yes gene_type:complete